MMRWIIGDVGGELGRAVSTDRLDRLMSSILKPIGRSAQRLPFPGSAQRSVLAEQLDDLRHVRERRLQRGTPTAVRTGCVGLRRQHQWTI
jgi:hypothetical protein